MPPKPGPGTRDGGGRPPPSAGATGGKTEAVSVYGRFRPVSKGAPHGPIELLNSRSVQVREYEFTLDGIFEEIATQQEVYSRSAENNVATVIDGLNTTLMAYGQTGSGKTHAMFGPDEVLSNACARDSNPQPPRPPTSAHLASTSPPRVTARSSRRATRRSTA